MFRKVNVLWNQTAELGNPKPCIEQNENPVEIFLKMPVRSYEIQELPHIGS